MFKSTEHSTVQQIEVRDGHTYINNYWNHLKMSVWHNKKVKSQPQFLVLEVNLDAMLTKYIYFEDNAVFEIDWYQTLAGDP